MNDRSSGIRKCARIRLSSILGVLCVTLAVFFAACAGGIEGIGKINLSPSKPLNKSPVNGAVSIGEQPILEWDPSEDPENDPLTYIILYSTDTINNSKVQTIMATETRAELAQLSAGTWWWRVLVVDAGNNIVRGDRWSFTVGSGNIPKTDTPDFDSDLIVVDIADDGVMLSWPAFYDEENPAMEVVYDLRVDDPSNLSSERASGWVEILSQDSRYLEVASTTAETSIRLEGLSPLTRFDGSLVARSASNTQTAVGFFSFRTGNLLPSTPTYIYPENQAVHIPATPTFRWDLCEDEDGDALTYDIYIGEDRLTAQRFTRAATEGIYIPEEPFENGKSYTWRIVAKDTKGGNRIGEWWTFSVGNATPSSLEPVRPLNHATNVSTRTSLEWACEDKEENALTYTLRFGVTPGHLAVVAEDLETSAYQFQNPLAYNQKYYWQVQADDGQAGANRAVHTGDVWEFTTEATPNYAPDKPVLKTPANKATNIPIDTQLTWTCQDENPEDVLVYSVYTGKTIGGLTVVGTTTETKFDLSGLEYQRKYYWKVAADDGRPSSERKEAVSSTWSFTTQATPNFAPETPHDPKPADGATGVALTPNLEWQCDDPNGDALEFTISWGSTNTALTHTATTISLNYPLTGLATGTSYYWRVRADDQKESSERLSAESPIWTFKTIETP